MYWNHSNQTIYSTLMADEAHMVVTMETSSAFIRSQGISKRTVFLKDGLAKYDISAGRLFVVSTFSSIFPSML